MASPDYMGEILPENYKLLQDSVYSHVGIVFEGDKRYLFEGRLAPIVEKFGLHSVNELCRVLHTDKSSNIGHMVAEAMTTNETFFFREPLQYEAIRTELLPRMARERQNSKYLRCWSAASSTGQEAYSLGVLLMEEGMGHWNVQILGTDFSSQVVERARAGKFHQIEVNRGLPVKLMVKYFKQSGIHWEIADEVRKMTRFETRDLRGSMHDLGPFDLVFCRNVMIYFDSATRKKIMHELHRTLVRGGWLLVGGAETVLGFDELFERHRFRDATVYVAR